MSQTTTEPIFEVTVPEPPPSTKFEREVAAFRRLLPELLKTHRGQYVAIHDEQVVDSGPDDIELVMKVYRRVGQVPICVSLVTEKQPICRIPHYREVKRA